MEFDLKNINQKFVSSITKETFYSIFHNKIMNYVPKSLLFVNLGFNI